MSKLRNKIPVEKPDFFERYPKSMYTQIKFEQGNVTKHKAQIGSVWLSENFEHSIAKK